VIGLLRIRADREHGRPSLYGKTVPTSGRVSKTISGLARHHGIWRGVLAQRTPPNRGHALGSKMIAVIDCRWDPQTQRRRER
jgi:hypothetical protein